MTDYDHQLKFHLDATRCLSRLMGYLGGDGLLLVSEPHRANVEDILAEVQALRDVPLFDRAEGPVLRPVGTIRMTRLFIKNDMLAKIARDARGARATDDIILGAPLGFKILMCAWPVIAVIAIALMLA